jgi:hypothetical protein
MSTADLDIEQLTIVLPLVDLAGLDRVSWIGCHRAVNC